MHQLTYKVRPLFDLEMHYRALWATIVTNKSPDHFFCQLGLREAPGFGKSKMDPAVVAEVIRLRELGTGFKEIKERTGVNQSSAHKICQAAGLTNSWRHL